jgi:hypothetical protein
MTELAVFADPGCFAWFRMVAWIVSPRPEHPGLVGRVLVVVQAQLQVLGAFRACWARTGLTFQRLIASASRARM